MGQGVGNLTWGLTILMIFNPKLSFKKSTPKNVENAEVTKSSFISFLGLITAS